MLAGGLGKRLRRTVPDLPKPLAPVGGRSFLEVLLISLGRKGFNRVILSLGYMADKVVTHFGCRFAGMELVHEVERTPLGTGGAVRQALSRCREDHAFVFNGDTFLDLDAAAVEALWQRERAPVIVAREVADTARYGCLEIWNGRVTGFSEKSASGPGLVNGGCYLFPIDLFDGFLFGRSFSLEVDFLPKAVIHRQFRVFVSKGRFIDIGTPEDYARAEVELTETGPLSRDQSTACSSPARRRTGCPHPQDARMPLRYRWSALSGEGAGSRCSEETYLPPSGCTTDCQRWKSR